MKLANADKLIHHFENTVDVKLFTVPEIVTIIDTFSSEVDESDLVSREALKKAIMSKRPTNIPSNDIMLAIHCIDNAQAVFGGRG